MNQIPLAIRSHNTAAGAVDAMARLRPPFLFLQCGVKIHWIQSFIVFPWPFAKDPFQRMHSVVVGHRPFPWFLRIIVQTQKDSVWILYVGNMMSGLRNPHIPLHRFPINRTSATSLTSSTTSSTAYFRVRPLHNRLPARLQHATSHFLFLEPISRPLERLG